MLLSPVEVVGLMLQIYLAYKTTGTTGIKCISVETLNEISRNALVFWVTCFAVVLLYILNIIFTTQVSTSKKLAKDGKYTLWKAKYMFTSYLLSRALSLLVSFKMNCIAYSYFLGRKRYFAEFDRKKPYFRIV